MEGGVFELDRRFYDVCTGFQRNSRYCGLFFFFFFLVVRGAGGGVGGGGLNVSAFFLGHLSVIFERDGLGGGVCIGAAVDGGVWINGEGGAVGDGLSASVGGGGKGGAGVFIEVEEELM